MARVELIQLIKIVQGRVVPLRLQWGIIQRRGGVNEMFSDIARPELFFGIKVDEWGVFEDIVGDLPLRSLLGSPLGLISPASPGPDHGFVVVAW